MCCYIKLCHHINYKETYMYLLNMSLQMTYCCCFIFTLITRVVLHIRFFMLKETLFAVKCLWTEWTGICITGVVCLQVPWKVLLNIKDCPAEVTYILWHDWVQTKYDAFHPNNCIKWTITNLWEILGTIKNGAIPFKFGLILLLTWNEIRIYIVCYWHCSWEWYWSPTNW